MKKSIGAKPTMLPLPALIIATYDEDGMPNAMQVGWGIQVSMSQIEINLSQHKTTDNIFAKKAFTCAIADEAHVVEADYFGIATGKKEDKAAKSGLTFEPSANVDAPVIEEFPLTMECTVDSIEEANGDWRITATVVNTLADESILVEKDGIDMAALKPICFNFTTRTYHAVGAQVGQAWHDGLALK